MSARSELIHALASAWVSAGLCPLKMAVKDATNAVDEALAEHAHDLAEKVLEISDAHLEACEKFKAGYRRGLVVAVMTIDSKTNLKELRK